MVDNVSAIQMTDGKLTIYAQIDPQNNPKRHFVVINLSAMISIVAQIAWKASHVTAINMLTNQVTTE